MGGLFYPSRTALVKGGRIRTPGDRARAQSPGAQEAKGAGVQLQLVLGGAGEDGAGDLARRRFSV